MIKAAIFDLDGTLIDSEPVYRASWREVLAPYGIEPTDADFRNQMGRQTAEVARNLCGLGDVEVDAALVAAGVLDAMMRNLPPVVMSGAEDAIALAQSLGLRLAVATGAVLSLAEASLRSINLADRFEAVVSADSEPYGKPHPGIFLSTAKALRVEASECVVIEDAPNGVLAAKAAGMRCICVPDNRVVSDAAMKQADVLLDSLEDLTAAILLGRSV